jgi:hypothetical protein
MVSLASKLLFKSAATLHLARLTDYFGNNAFGEIATTKIVLCHSNK